MRSHWLAAALITALIQTGPLSALASEPATTYVVTGEMTSLGEISLFLYGKAGMHKKIAEWNGLAPPYRIKPGVTLKLEQKPTLDPAEGATLVLKMWRRLMGLPDSSAIVAAQGVSASESLDRGKELFEKKRYMEALAYLRRSREGDRENVTSWLYEIRALKLLGRAEEEKELRARFLQNFPEIQQIPGFTDGMPSVAPVSAPVAAPSPASAPVSAPPESPQTGQP